MKAPINRPYAIEAIDQKGTSVYRHPQTPPTMLAGGDRVAFYQLRTILEGVLTRGTARSLAHLGGYVGGKTGTTDDENDAWFASFTKDVTVVVWVGYDNLNGRRTLGSSGTGGRVAAPIAEPIIQASWNSYPKTLLPPPSPQLARQVRAVPMGRGPTPNITGSIPAVASRIPGTPSSTSTTTTTTNHRGQSGYYSGYGTQYQYHISINIGHPAPAAGDGAAIQPLDPHPRAIRTACRAGRKIVSDRIC